MATGSSDAWIPRTSDRLYRSSPCRMIDRFILVTGRLAGTLRRKSPRGHTVAMPLHRRAKTLVSAAEQAPDSLDRIVLVFSQHPQHAMRQPRCLVLMETETDVR